MDIFIFLSTLVGIIYITLKWCEEEFKDAPRLGCAVFGINIVFLVVLSILYMMLGALFTDSLVFPSPVIQNIGAAVASPFLVLYHHGRIARPNFSTLNISPRKGSVYPESEEGFAPLGSSREANRERSQMLLEWWEQAFEYESGAKALRDQYNESRGQAKIVLEKLSVIDFLTQGYQKELSLHKRAKEILEINPSEPKKRFATAAEINRATQQLLSSSHEKMVLASLNERQKESERFRNQLKELENHTKSVLSQYNAIMGQPPHAAPKAWKYPRQSISISPQQTPLPIFSHNNATEDNHP